MAHSNDARRSWASVALTTGFMLIVFALAALFVVGVTAAPASGPRLDRSLDGRAEVPNPTITCVPGTNCLPRTETPEATTTFEPVPTETPFDPCNIRPCTKTITPETATPLPTCIPGIVCATPTETPCNVQLCGTRTVEPDPTAIPTSTCTPSGNCVPLTRTVEPVSTHTPRPTCAPGTNCLPATRTVAPDPTETPRATASPYGVLRIRPRVQFGRGTPGSVVEYHQLLLNRFQQANLVNLEGVSLSDWRVDVDPSELIAVPNETNRIRVEVGVPDSPGHPIDLEYTVALAQGARPAYGYLITILHRQAISDVAEGHWADGPIQYLLSEGVVTGYNDGTFRPNAEVTRAQFAKMLVGAMDWRVQNPQTPTFSDVPAGHWAYGYIETAAAHGIITGYADGTFRPNANVTRAQVAKMIATARNWPLDIPLGVNFTDVRSTDWYYSYARAVSAAEVMSGYNDGTFRPNASATRAQIAKILVLSLFSSPDS